MAESCGFQRDRVLWRKWLFLTALWKLVVSIIRKLVDKVVLTPVADEEGRKSLTIDLHGHLAGILSLATKAKRPLSESGLPVEYTKLVAGAEFEPTTFR
jgi:hypothetical protein